MSVNIEVIDFHMHLPPNMILLRTVRTSGLHKGLLLGKLISNLVLNIRTQLIFVTY